MRILSKKHVKRLKICYVLLENATTLKQHNQQIPNLTISLTTDCQFRLFIYFISLQQKLLELFAKLSTKGYVYSFTVVHFLTVKTEVWQLDASKGNQWHKQK